MRAITTLIEMFGRVSGMDPVTAREPTKPVEPAEPVYPNVIVSGNAQFDENSNEVLYVSVSIVEAPGTPTQVLLLSAEAAELLLRKLTECLCEKE